MTNRPKPTVVMTEEEVHGKKLIPYEREGWTQHINSPLVYAVSKTEHGLMLDVVGNHPSGFQIDKRQEETRYRTLLALFEERHSASDYPLPQGLHSQTETV